MAVTRVVWGGRVVLHGNGTERKPFDCSGTTAHAHRQGIRVTRNVTIASLSRTRARVTCRNGFHFDRSHENLRITLSGISFFRTPLNFRNCSYVKIANVFFLRTPLKFTDSSYVEIADCICRDTQKVAITVQVKTSQSVNVTVRNSLFQNNSVCLNTQFEEVHSKTDVQFSMNIYKTKFLENGLSASTTERGAVFFSDKTRNFSRTIYLHVVVENVTCVAGKGHFLMIRLPTAVTKETYRNVNLERNRLHVSRSLYYSCVKMASVAFFGLQCRNNSETRCLTIRSFVKANKTIYLSVQGSRIYDNSYNRSKRAAIFAVKGNGAQSGTISIVNTSFVRNHRFSAISITPNLKIRLSGVTVKSSSLGVGIQYFDKFPLNESNFSLDVSINNCTFLNNLEDFFGLLNNTFNVQFQISNTLFEHIHIHQKEVSAENSNFAIRVIIPPARKAILTKVNIDMKNVTFIGRPANSFVLLAKGNKRVNIRGCKFRDGFSLETNEWIITRYKSLPGYVTGQGVFLFLFDSDELVKPGCVKARESRNIHPEWNYTNHVLFEDSTFENNGGSVAGAIQIINGYTMFRRCTFSDNFAIGDTGHVYVGYGSAKVVLNCCVFKRTKGDATYRGDKFTVGRFLHSDSGGPIMIKNTSFATNFSQRLSPQPILRILSGGFFSVDMNSTIQCTTGSSLRFDNYTHFHYDGGQDNTFCRINVTTEMFFCQMCPPRMYGLHKGFSRGLSPVKNDNGCIECPFGAHCNGPRNIVAKPDFWGYKITNSCNFSSLTFVPCPEEYCRTPSATSQNNDYNSCYGNRSGILCGQCAPGFSETLLSTECRKSEECRWNYLLWILMALYTIGLTVYLLKKPPLVHFLKDQIFWFRKDGQQELDECSCHGKDDHENGYLKITFYFYQVVELLSTTSLENMMIKVPYIATVVSVFNFQVRIVDEGIGCPFAGLTAVTKEIFLSALVFAAIVHVFVIYCLHLVVSLTLKKYKPSLAHYVAVAMEIMLLGYERLAETSLKLMHCVSIGSEWRLYFDGNIVCWQWWQYGLLAFNIIFVAPFVGVLYWGSHKLYNKTLSWKSFVCACIFPLPYLVYWLGKRLCFRRSANQGVLAAPSCEYTSLASLPLSGSVSHGNRDGCTDEISQILYGPFRAPNAHDQGTLYWESVLIGRRLILIMFRAFIPNSMICFLCMSVACVLMVVHHLLKQPYRDQAAERMETLSLVALSCISILNVTTATLASSAVRPEGPNKSIIVVLQWIQVAILCVAPAVIVLLILFAVFSQLLRLAIFLYKKMCISCFTTQRNGYESLQENTALISH